ncbi:hypothetical protein R6Q59_036136 [Mikania micrantha]
MSNVSHKRWCSEPAKTPKKAIISRSERGICNKLAFASVHQSFIIMRTITHSNLHDMNSSINQTSLAGNNVNTNEAPMEDIVISPALMQQVFVEASKANDFVAFYKSAFGAEELIRTSHPIRKANQDLLLLLLMLIMLGSTWYYIYDFRRSQ